MDFSEAQAYIAGVEPFGIRLGLQRMDRLMTLLGHPEEKLRCIHVAGTNGKGSVTSYCSSILAAAGLRTGVYTSPHLVRITDRIRIIDGRNGLTALLANEAAGEISETAFAAAITAVSEAVEVMLQEGYEHPTEFELVTAAGFLHFAACHCDVVVLEVGLGGRLDSTNVISQPLACIITALGYDHMDRLGGTLAEIAAEKAGIIKEGCPVFFYNPTDLELTVSDAAAAEAVVRNRCTAMNASLQLVRRRELTMLEYGWNGQSFTDRVSGLTLRTSLLGLFQPMNAALAARVCQHLHLASNTEIQEGIRLARWPARLEILRRKPPILLDGAHNPQCCQALAEAMERLLPGQPVIFLAGMLRDKDYESMLRIMLDHRKYRPVAFICVTPDSPRALPADQLAVCVRKLCGEMYKKGSNEYNILDAVHIADSPAEGALKALRLADQKGVALCVFTSLYVIGTIRDIIRTQEAQPWIGNS